MKHKTAKAAGLLTTLMILSTLAAALGVGPSEFRLEKALKGEEYKKTAKVFNTDPMDSVITIGRSGEAASWLTLYAESDLNTPIESLTIPAGKNVLILIKFKIPPTAANGDYEATLTLENSPEGDPNAAQSVTMSMPMEFFIEVTGDQILEGSTRSITTRDVEINYPLEIKVEFENKGNVVAKPDIKVDIKKDAQQVASATYSGASVEPTSYAAIPVELNTSNLLPGNYTADVSVLLGDKLMGEENLSFSLLPIGTLTRAGLFEALAYAGETAAGKLLKIDSVFRNTGRINTKAFFAGEVYRDGELVDSIKSDEILVPVDGTASLVSYLKLETPGDYRITGSILYEGKKTEPRELSFTAQAAKAPEEKTPSTTIAAPDAGAQKDGTWAIGVGLALVLVLVAFLAYLTFKKNGKGEGKRTSLEK